MSPSVTLDPFNLLKQTAAPEAKAPASAPEPEREVTGRSGLWNGRFKWKEVGGRKVLAANNQRRGTDILLLPNPLKKEGDNQPDFDAYLADQNNPTNRIKNGQFWQKTHTRDGRKLDKPFLSGYWDFHQARINLVDKGQERDGEVAFMYVSAKPRDNKPAAGAEEAEESPLFAGEP